MNFSKILFAIFACFMAFAAVSAAPEPRWNPFKKLERVGQNIRDGIVKAQPAIQVVGEAATIYRGGK
ncbi:cecropin-like [Ostrinia furnacalis]|uniref:Cecropin A n=1 Tax=Ostrinia furnacalis TaxID=93504 RepID=A0A3G2BAH3_OSTFU|nr:cecropin-like [Ostrinia furnacalis]AYM26647.1 cecropin A [Ostrinia furnacalis]